jgi:hypothetical protein
MHPRGLVAGTCVGVHVSLKVASLRLGIGAVELQQLGRHVFALAADIHADGAQETVRLANEGALAPSDLASDGDGLSAERSHF